ncbi:MAG: tyrosine--tRNA ligase [Deltaproteobacteria bacterium]|nr:tyrosine--tRNA ligase [Deltaproteobacteria bacterium]
MGTKSIEEQLALIEQKSVEIISSTELVEKLKLGRPLRIKAGFDPTSPDIHLGHTIIINQMKVFQELGHEVIFVVGSFTAMVGDPSGASATRKHLSAAEVEKNAQTYAQQAFKILDRKQTKIVFNHDWLGKLSAADICELASQMTVARMLERDDFEQRFATQKPIAIHEFLYPLFQGYDSVHIKADVELGGTDQKFNLLVGRELQKNAGQSPQAVILLPLLEGTDGVRKMSKSLGNYIGVAEASKDIYGKIMALSDELMWRYYELLTSYDSAELMKLKKGVEAEKLHPKQVKSELAKEIVERYYDRKTALREEEEFEKIFADKKIPSEIEELKLKVSKEEHLSLLQVLSSAKLVVSNAEGRRMIQQGAVRVDGKKIQILEFQFTKRKEPYLIQVGKRKFLRLILAS